MTTSSSVTLNALTSTTAALSKKANGEYTAASVTADPKDAAKLGLVKEADGNYGTMNPTAAASSAPQKTSPSVLAAVTSFKLGGE